MGLCLAGDRPPVMWPHGSALGLALFDIFTSDQDASVECPIPRLLFITSWEVLWLSWGTRGLADISLGTTGNKMGLEESSTAGDRECLSSEGQLSSLHCLVGRKRAWGAPALCIFLRRGCGEGGANLTSYNHRAVWVGRDLQRFPWRDPVLGSSDRARVSDSKLHQERSRF